MHQAEMLFTPGNVKNFQGFGEKIGISPNFFTKLSPKCLMLPCSSPYIPLFFLQYSGKEILIFQGLPIPKKFKNIQPWGQGKISL